MDGTGNHPEAKQIDVLQIQRLDEGNAIVGSVIVGSRDIAIASADPGLVVYIDWSSICDIVDE